MPRSELTSRAATLTLALSLALALSALAATSPRAQPADACRSSTDHTLTIRACSDIIAAAANANAPPVVLALFRRGYAYFATNQIDRGLADIGEALRRDQATAAGAPAALQEELALARLRGHSIVAAVYSDRKQYELALQHIAAAIDLQPDRRAAALLYGLRGEVAFGQQRYDAAIDDFGTAARLNPANREMFRRRGDAYSLLGRYDQARAEYDAAIRLDPNDAESYRLRCRTNALSGQLDAALSDCNRMIELDGQQHRALLVLRGLVFLKMARFAQAAIDFEAILAQAATQPDALFGRGLARLGQGDARGRDDIASAQGVDAAVTQRFADWDLRP